MLGVATANVNGIRAAVRRGVGAWFAEARPDVIALQEVRADDDALAAGLPSWMALAVHEPSVLPGRAGVAIAVREGIEVDAVRTGLDGLDSPDHTGRWVEADLRPDGWDRPLTVVSTYVPVGEVDSPKQQAKYAFLEAMTTRMGELFADGRDVIVGGDVNIAHREADLKNWRGNIGKRGFLPAERAYLDAWLAAGWVDVGRMLAGEHDGPYTWWSWRGKAFDNDAGWRIDCQYATPGLAARAREARVDRAPTYAERWSDHAPFIVDYG
jgi:exodeoxyribonuclease-3